jgi:hypothetical protein
VSLKYFSVIFRGPPNKEIVDQDLDD